MNPLDRVVTADEFVVWLDGEVVIEASFTESNESEHRIGDYVADLHRRLGRLLGEES